MSTGSVAQQLEQTEPHWKRGTLPTTPHYPQCSKIEGLCLLVESNGNWFYLQEVLRGDTPMHYWLRWSMGFEKY